MGNLGRYGYPDVKPIEHCGCRDSRTTGISESRMKVVKHNVLSDEVSSRVDQVVQKLGSRIRQIEINYSTHYLLNLTRNRKAKAKKLCAEEGWDKRDSSKRSTTSTYSTTPKVPLIETVKTALRPRSNAVKQPIGKIFFIQPDKESAYFSSY